MKAKNSFQLRVLGVTPQNKKGSSVCCSLFCHGASPLGEVPWAGSEGPPLREARGTRAARTLRAPRNKGSRRTARSLLGLWHPGVSGLHHDVIAVIRVDRDPGFVLHAGALEIRQQPHVRPLQVACNQYREIGLWSRARRAERESAQSVNSSHTNESCRSATSPFLRRKIGFRRWHT